MKLSDTMATPIEEKLDQNLKVKTTKQQQKQYYNSTYKCH